MSHKNGQDSTIFRSSPGSGGVEVLDRLGIRGGRWAEDSLTEVLGEGTEAGELEAGPDGLPARPVLLDDSVALERCAFPLARVAAPWLLIAAADDPEIEVLFMPA